MTETFPPVLRVVQTMSLHFQVDRMAGPPCRAVRAQTPAMRGIVSECGLNVS
jgi:hypothetical protein